MGYKEGKNGGKWMLDTPISSYKSLDNSWYITFVLT